MWLLQGHIAMIRPDQAALLARSPGACSRLGLLGPGLSFPGELRQAVPLHVLGVGEADRPQILRGQPLVDLVQMLADQPLLRIGGLALVRLARVLERRVVDPVLPGRDGRGGTGDAPGRPGGGQESRSSAGRWPACRTPRRPAPPAGAGRRRAGRGRRGPPGRPPSRCPWPHRRALRSRPGHREDRGAPAITMRAGASSSVMSWPLRSLNLTVFWPTGSSLLVAVAGAVGSTREAATAVVARDAYAAAPEPRLSNICSTNDRTRVENAAILFSIQRDRPATNGTGWPRSAVQACCQVVPFHSHSVVRSLVRLLPPNSTSRCRAGS